LLLKGCYATAIFRWAGSLPADTDGIDLLGRKRQNAFQPDLVLPPISEVILVEKPFSEPEVELGQANLVGILMKGKSSAPGHTEILAVDTKPVQMEVAPAEGNLEAVVQIRQGLVGAQQQPTPDHRADSS
jgi:hypothetical protein